MIKIYHNPRCGKSREAIQILENENKTFEIIKYLDNPLDKNEITDLIKHLKIKPLDLVRTKEKIWIDQFKNQKLNDDDIIKILVDHPILIERPIVINKNKAIIGRPPILIKSII
jgi:arsenate reductase